MNQQLFANNFAATFKAAIAVGDLSATITVTKGALPVLANGDFIVLNATQAGAYDGETSWEGLKVTAWSGSLPDLTINFTREFYGVATAWPQGAKCDGRLPASTLNGLSKLLVNRALSSIGMMSDGVGLTKPHGCQAQVIEAWNTPSGILKMELEAPFSRVRIWVFSRNALGSSNWEFSVAPTENGAPDGNIANTWQPWKGGVVNNAAQDATHDWGWQRVTFNGGGGGVSMSGLLDGGMNPNYTSGKLYPSTDFPNKWQQGPTMNALGDALVSDWINCQSIPPKTPGPAGYSRPFLLIRSNCLSGGFPVEKTDNYVSTPASAKSDYDAWAAGSKARRLVYFSWISNGSGADPASNFTLMPSSAVPPDGNIASLNYPYIGVEVDYNVKVRSFACFGDSNTEGYSWPFEALAQMSTPNTPYTWANFGMSTCRSVQYFSMMDMVLKKGLRPTDVLFPSHSSNDNPNTVYDFDQLRAQMLERIKLCNELGITPWIWTHFYGVNNGVTGANNSPQEADYLNWIRAICATGKAKLVDIAAGWVRSTMRSNDNTHPNATGIAYCTNVFLNALKAG